MNRQALLEHLREHGCRLFREGSNHSIYLNLANRRTTVVPRHREIDNKMAAKICRQLGIDPPL